MLRSLQLEEPITQIKSKFIHIVGFSEAANRLWAVSMTLRSLQLEEPTTQAST